MNRPVAAFELDALFPESLMASFVSRMISLGHLPEKAREAIRAPEEKRLRLFGRYLKGVRFEDAEDAANALIEEWKDRALSYPREELRALKRRGYFLLAISGAPRFLVDGIAHETGFEKSYGSFFSTGAADRFTGAVEDEEVITNRAAVLRRAVKKEALTLMGSVGLAGSHSFAPLLEAVSRPIAFNPDDALARRARMRGWKVVLEERGVVYKL